jgi:hypothetical protein
MKRILITTICLFSAFGISQAQMQSQTQSEKLQLQTRAIRYSKHEFSVYAAFGISTINYKLAGDDSFDYGCNNSKNAIDYGINYAYNFNSRIAILTGLNYASYSGRLSLNGYSADYTAYDNRGDKFTMHYSLDGEYHENQSIALLNVPLMARYSFPIGKGGTKYFASGGLKLGIPIIYKTTITPGAVSTSGRYEYEAREYTDLLEYGFVDGRRGDGTTRRIHLGVIPMLSFDIGLRFPLGYITTFVMSVYIDHSFGNIQGYNDKQIVEYQSLFPSHFVYNSVLNTAMVDKITLFNAGFKIGVAF